MAPPTSNTSQSDNDESIEKKIWFMLTQKQTLFNLVHTTDLNLQRFRVTREDGAGYLFHRPYPPDDAFSRSLTGPQESCQVHISGPLSRFSNRQQSQHGCWGPKKLSELRPKMAIQRQTKAGAFLKFCRSLRAALQR